MNLEQVQSVYLLLKLIANEEVNFELYVESSNKLFSADFIKFTLDPLVICKKNLNNLYGVKTNTFSLSDGTYYKYLWALIAEKWTQSPENILAFVKTPKFNIKELFSNPEALLNEITEFVSKNSINVDSVKFSNVIYNVKFENNQFDFYQFPDKDLNIVSLKVLEF